MTLNQPPIKLVLFAGLFTFTILGAEQGLLGIILARYSEQHGIAASKGGLFFAAHAIGASITVALSLIHKLDQANPYRVAISLGLVTIGFALVATVDAWPLFLCSALLLGLGFGGLILGFNTLFATRFAAKGPFFLNVLNTAFGFGAVFAPLFLALEWLSLFHLLCFFAVTCLALLLATRGLDDRVAAQHEHTASAAPKITLWLLVAALFFAQVVEANIITWLPTMMLQAGLSYADSAAAVSRYFTYFLVIRIIASAISLRVPAAVLATLGGSICLAVFAVIALGIQPITVMPLAGVGVGLLFPNQFGYSLNAIGGGTRESAFLLLASLAGATLGPWVMGFIAERNDPFVISVTLTSASFALLATFLGGVASVKKTINTKSA